MRIPFRTFDPCASSDSLEKSSGRYDAATRSIWLGYAISDIFMSQNNATEDFFGGLGAVQKPQNGLRLSSGGVV
jgi:hypothetical protein